MYTHRKRTHERDINARLGVLAAVLGTRKTTSHKTDVGEDTHGDRGVAGRAEA